MTGRDRTMAIVHEHLGECSDDELRAIGTLLSRLEVGRERYGRLELAADRRDWQREADEELADAAIYLAIARLARSAL